MVAFDVHDQVKVTEVISGSQVILSCLSNWGSEQGDVLTAAMRAVVPAMKKVGVRRIISLTGNAAFTPDDKPTALQKANRAMLAKLAPKVLADGEAPVSYTHLRAHETVLDLVCRLLLEKKNKNNTHKTQH